jgi:hypothetical protein
MRLANILVGLAHIVRLLDGSFSGGVCGCRTKNEHLIALLASLVVGNSLRCVFRLRAASDDDLSPTGA